MPACHIFIRSACITCLKRIQNGAPTLKLSVSITTAMKKRLSGEKLFSIFSRMVGFCEKKIASNIKLA